MAINIGVTIFVTIITTITTLVTSRDQIQCGKEYVERSTIDVNGTLSSETTTSQRFYVPAYLCPTKSHTDSENRCCSPAQFNCCRAATFWEIEQRIAIVISISVLLLAVLITLLLIICFCNDACPLHKLIRRSPKPDYIAHPDETINLTGTQMPAENGQKVRVYQVNTDVIYRQNKELV